MQEEQQSDDTPPPPPPPPAKKRMRPQSCKAKGRRFQQQIAASITGRFPSLTDDDVWSTSMGCGGEDIRLSTAAREKFPYSVECKNVEKINIWQCLEQAKANAPQGTTPCLAFTRNRSPTYAVIPWDVFLSLQKD